MIRLSRIRLAFLDIKNLKSGEYRELSLKEVKKIKYYVIKKKEVHIWQKNE